MLSSDGDIIFDPMVVSNEIIKIAQSLNRKVIGVQNSD
jgi:hypothetical protein